MNNQYMHLTMASNTMKVEFKKYEQLNWQFGTIFYHRKKDFESKSRLHQESIDILI